MGFKHTIIDPTLMSLQMHIVLSWSNTDVLSSLEYFFTICKSLHDFILTIRVRLILFVVSVSEQNVHNFNHYPPIFIH